MADFLTLKPIDDAASGPMYILRTQSGREIAHLFTVNDKWTIWSGEGFFSGLSGNPHPTLPAMLVWILAVVQVPIIITGGKTDGKTGRKPRDTDRSAA